MNRSRSLAAVATVILLFSAGPAVAGEDELTQGEKEVLAEYGEIGRFRYGSSWWQEHHADPHTSLLIHFGKPEPYSLRDLSAEGKKRRREEREIERLMVKLLHASGTDTTGNDLDELSAQMEERAEQKLKDMYIQLKGQFSLPPVPEPEVPDRTVYDYSYHRRQYPIKDIPGLTIDPEGRFGSAVRFDGTGPGMLLLTDDDPITGQKKGWSSHFNMCELWVKVPEYPEKNACIFSCGGGEGRMMLRPDGHLDFVRKNPLGLPMKGWFKAWSNEEAFENIYDLDMTLVSETPVPVGEWFHLALWRSETFVVNLHTLHMLVNGEEEGLVVGTPMDRYNPFIGGRYGGEKDPTYKFRIGNDESGEHPFTGMIDDVRTPKGRRVIGDTPQRKINPPVEPMDWRDPDGTRPLDFGRPYFYRNGHQWMLDFEKGLEATSFQGRESFSAELTRELPEKEIPRLFTEGVRGKALIVDPLVSRVRIPVEGRLSMDAGSVEFWLQPLNWDNAAGRPGLPTFRINLMRIYCETPQGEVLSFPIARLPNREGGTPTVFRPGKWTFFCLTWDHPRPTKKFHKGGGPWGPPTRSAFEYYLYKEPSSPRDKRRKRFRARTEEENRRFLPCYAYDLKPLYIEFGVHKPAVGIDNRDLRIAVDEVVVHDYELSPIEVYQAQKRVKGRLERFKSIKLTHRYKYGLDELTGTLRTLFPPHAGVRTASVTVRGEDGTVFAGPVTSEIQFGEEGEEGKDRAEGEEATEGEEAAEGKAEFLLSEDKPVPPMEQMTFHVQVMNEAGEVVAEDDSTTWTFDPGEWRGNDLGVPTEAPEPWTPVEVEGRTLRTLMTQYELGENGLPAAIIAKGENVLQSPIRLLEDGKPMKASGLTIGDSENVQAEWTVSFRGATCTAELTGRIEFDGLTRYELDLDPTTADGTVAPIRFEIPMKHGHSTHRLFEQSRSNDLVCDGSNVPDVYTSRHQLLRHAKRRYNRLPKHRRKDREEPTDETFRVWDFWTIMDMCSRDRGLYWFADNAAGWGQSDLLTAQEFRRRGDEHLMILHLVAEEMPYTAERPIVFGILPHPAKPVPQDYRYMEKAPSPQDPDIVRTYTSVFAPLPDHPRDGGSTLNMRVYPKEGSFEKAKEAKVFMRMMMPYYKPMYLSLAWLSTRAGAYDNWKWRNGASSKVSLCDSFIEYLCWEMDGWLQRDMYNAIYLDECYAWSCTGNYAVEAGMSLEMPDGTVQPGQRLWGFRELMKRWYTLFQKYDHRPMILAHHSRNWMYPGMVFATSNLDGEGFPAVTRHQKLDFMDKIDFSRLEIINSPWLWGSIPFYMPCIWENGFANRGEGTHPAWTWRIARSGLGLFAHLEQSYVYMTEGGGFFNRHWRAVKEWGALPREVEFVPWYRENNGVQTPDPFEETLVSYYKDDGRVLFIITNRTKEERVIELTLDYETLGLPETPKMRKVEGIYEQPEGIDPWEFEKTKPKVREDAITHVEDETVDSLMGALDADIAEAEGETIPTEPWIEGDVLHVPVLPHNFRMISLEE
jgi:hypothetical protein